MTGHQLWQPGDRITGDTNNLADLVGRLVFQAFRAAAQSISSTAVPDAANALGWDTIGLDLLDAWSAGNPSRFTPPIPGWYRLVGGVGLVATSSGSVRGCGWLLNGSNGVSGGQISIVTNATIGGFQTAVPARDLAIQLDGDADYVELAAVQASGSARNTEAVARFQPHMSAYYVGPP